MAVPRCANDLKTMVPGQEPFESLEHDGGIICQERPDATWLRGPAGMVGCRLFHDDGSPSTGAIS